MKKKDCGPSLILICKHGLMFLPLPLGLCFLTGYFGSACEEKVDPCASSPCQNNGTCYADGVRFSCSCSAGFTGPTCAQLVDFCALSPCAHGSCRSVGTSYKCLCEPGWYPPLPHSLSSLGAQTSHSSVSEPVLGLNVFSCTCK